MADAKWITGLTADTPLPEAARRVLDLRLGAVRKLLPLAVRSAHKDVEHVHRLRVSTRRCRAAIDLLRVCLPDKLYERLRKTLRRIRRSAGAARDCDVFLLHLGDHLNAAGTKNSAGLHWIAGEFCAARAVAQAHLRDESDESRRALARLLRNVGAELGKRKTGTDAALRAHAGPHLLQLVHELEEQATVSPRNLVQLHQVRIHGKRLRYAIEVFAGAFAEDLRQQLYPVVEEMQGILGDLNDHAVAVRRLTEMSKGARRFHPKLWPLWRPGVNAYLSRQRRQLAVERRHFRKFWEAWVRKGVGPRFCAIVGESKTPTPRGPSEF